MNIQLGVLELSIMCLDDWSPVGVVCSVATEICGSDTPETIRRTSLDILRCAVSQQKIEIGDITKDGFAKWPMPLDEALEVIEREWLELGHDPSLGDICWLSITPAGRQDAMRHQEMMSDCVQGLLSLGTNRLVSACDVALVSAEVSGFDCLEDVLWLSARVTLEAVWPGYVEIGDLVIPRSRGLMNRVGKLFGKKNSGVENVVDAEGNTKQFRPWGLNSFATEDRLFAEWSKLGRHPEPGELFWLRNTAKGNEMARELLEAGSQGKGEEK